MSAAQWTNPDPKSAVTMPQKPAIAIGLKFSNRNLTRINIELTIMSVMQMPTQMHSWVLFPETKQNIMTMFYVPKHESIRDMRV